MDYFEFLEQKTTKVAQCGFEVDPADLCEAMFPHQVDAVRFLLRVGRGSAFLDTGLGKTLVQLEWARQVSRFAAGRVLILSPLAVAKQTEAEARRFGIDGVEATRDPMASTAPIVVTNYERLHQVDPEMFVGVVLDESSILKSFMGKTKRSLVDAFESTEFRLCCTATPAPNDHIELGNHSEFLGVMPGYEMLSRFFVNDTMDMGKWRLKRHAVVPFWDWVCSWAICVSKPEDLGHDGSLYDLPELHLERHVVDVESVSDRGDNLFRIPDMSATAMHRERRISAPARAAEVARIVDAEPDESWLIWVDTDYEADELRRAIPYASEVRGGDRPDVKEERLLGFSSGAIRVLIAKPKIAGFGLNWQHCARVVFCGLGYSYESFYQAVRRTWRFGQTREVQVHVVIGANELSAWNIVSAKRDGHDEMRRQMIDATHRSHGRRREVKRPYNPTQPTALPSWIKEVRA